MRRSVRESALVVGVGVVAAASLLGSVAIAAGGKVTICHRTRSTTNPYRRINVSVSAVNGSSANDHSHHTGAVFDPAYAYPSNAKVWGDVIPDNASGGAGAGVNWTTAGKAMYASSYCKGMTAQEFYNSQREAGVPREEIIADLEEQRADEDKGVTFATMTYTGNDSSLPDYEGSSASPSPSPSAEPSEGSASPEPSATAAPSQEPTESVAPSGEPSAEPTEVALSGEPTESVAPSGEPTESVAPSSEPTESVAPSGEPTESVAPSAEPTAEPSAEPSGEPTESVAPSGEPTESAAPSGEPTESAAPSAEPSVEPSEEPAPEPTAPAPPGATARVSGTVWLDLDADATHDPAEPGIPQVAATLALAPGLPVPPPATARTDAAGTVRFTKLPPGAYRLTAAVPAGMRVTGDSQGALDGAAALTLAAGGEGRMWAGLAGTAGVQATVVDADGNPVSGPVTIRWAGPDGVLGTGDDVVVDAVAVDGVVTVTNLPAGEYVLAANGVRTNATLAGSRTTTVVLGTRAAAPRLPDTGGPVAEALALAVACLGAGGAAMRAGRRRPAHVRTGG